MAILRNASNLKSNSGLMHCCSYIAEKQIKNNFSWVVDKLILVATVYFIWQERNGRLFKGESRNEEMFINCIKDNVKTKLMTVCVKKSFKAQVIASKWGLQWN